MADCGDCRETLFLYVRVPGEELENADEILRPMSDDRVRQQAKRVLAFIASDEASQSSAHREPERVKPERSGFFVSYAQLGFAATLVIAVAIAIGYMATDTRNEHEEGLQAYAELLKADRRTASRNSGNFPYAPNRVTRGDGKSDDFQFDMALEKFKFAEEESAPAESRQALAWIYLSRDKPGDADKPSDAMKALLILENVLTRTEATPELLNDKGMALYQLERFPEAIRAYSQALEKKPDYQDALFNRGLAYTRAGFYNGARKDLQDFIEITSDEEWKREAIDRLNKLPQ